MKNRKSIFVIAAFLLCATVPVMGQEDEDEDEKKMIREVITVEMDRPPVVTPPKVETPVVTDKKHKNKKHVEETPPAEEIPAADTLSATVPATIAELKKRGDAWAKKKVKEFEKKDVVANGNSMQCTVTMPYFPKELNPGPHVDGTITMKVIVDYKEGKYRYTIKDIKHDAKNPDFSCGDVYNEIPACGTLSVPDPNWKRIRSYGIKAAQQVAANLKASMKQPVVDKKKDW